MAPKKRYAADTDFRRTFGFDCNGLEYHLFDDDNPADPSVVKKFVTTKRDVLQAQIERHVRGVTLVTQQSLI